MLPLEIKSGKDYTEHSALTKFLESPEYGIEKAMVFSNERRIYQKKGVTSIGDGHGFLDANAVVFRGGHKEAFSDLHDGQGDALVVSCAGGDGDDSFFVGETNQSPFLGAEMELKVWDFAAIEMG